MRTLGSPAVTQILLALIGAAAFCVYSRSWVDTAHLAYDIPAGLATFAFIAQLVVEPWTERVDRFWFYRLAMVAAMTAATSGRQYLGWSISGHLSCVLAIALVQSGDRRLPLWERGAYWVPVPVVLGLRLLLLEQGGHTATWCAMVFAVVCGVPGMMLGRQREERKPRIGTDENG